MPDKPTAIEVLRNSRVATNLDLFFATLTPDTHRTILDALKLAAVWSIRDAAP